MKYWNEKKVPQKYKYLDKILISDEKEKQAYYKIEN